MSGSSRSHSQPPSSHAAGAPSGDSGSGATGDGEQLRRSSELLIGRGFALTVNLITQLLLVRVLTRDDFGALAFGLAIATSAETMVALGLDRAVSRYLAIYDETGQRAQARGLLRAVTLTMGATTTLFLVTGGVLLSLGWSGERALTFALLALLGPLLAADSVLLAVLSVFSKSRRILVRRFIFDPLLRLTAVAVTGLFAIDVEWLAGAYLAIGVLGTAWLAAGAFAACSALAEQPGQGRSPNGGWNFGPVVLFAFPLFSNDLVQLIVNSLDALTVGALGTLDDVATLRAVQPVARLNQLVLLSFGYLFVPTAARKLVRGAAGDIDTWYWKATASVALLSWPFFLLTFTAADPIVDLLFGDRYRSSREVLAVLALGHFANAAFGFNGMTLNVYAKVRLLVAVNLAALAVGVLLNLTLVPRYGPIGAALAVSGTLIVHNVLRQVALSGATSVRLTDSHHRRFFAIVLGSVLISIAAKAASPGWPVELGLGLVLSLPVFIAGSRCVELRELNPLRRRVVRR